MKKAFAAALMLALLAGLAGPAVAQKNAPKGDRDKEQQLRPGEEPRPVIDEKKYKSAVDSMGTREAPKVDPWAGVRDKK